MLTILRFLALCDTDVRGIKPSLGNNTTWVHRAHPYAHTVPVHSLWTSLAREVKVLCPKKLGIPRAGASYWDKNRIEGG